MFCVSVCTAIIVGLGRIALAIANFLTTHVGIDPHNYSLQGYRSYSAAKFTGYTGTKKQVSYLLDDL